MGVPDSAIPAAEGYARASGIPYGQGLVKNRYIGRTFISPDQVERDQGVRRKLNPLRGTIAGKRLIVVDDSIVRGTTTRAVVRMLRDAGAAEVHLRISSPPYRWPCYYGLDTGTRAELIAANLDGRRDPGLRRAPTAWPTSSLDALRGGHRRARRRVLQRLPDRRLPGGGAGDPVQGRARTDRCLTSPADRRADRRRRGRPDLRRRRGRHRRRRPGRRRHQATWSRSTYRPEVIGDIGGFGGLFAVPPGYRHPVLVAATDGVGTKMAVARRPGRLRHRRHRPGRHVRRRPGLPGGRAAVLPRLPGPRPARPRPGRRADGGHRRRLPPGRLRHHRRRAGRASRVMGRATSTWSASRSGSSSATGSSTGGRSRPGDVLIGLPSPGLRSNGYSLARRALLDGAGRRLDGPAWDGARRPRWPTSCSCPR